MNAVHGMFGQAPMRYKVTIRSKLLPEGHLAACFIHTLEARSPEEAVAAVTLMYLHGLNGGKIEGVPPHAPEGVSAESVERADPVFLKWDADEAARMVITVLENERGRE